MNQGFFPALGDFVARYRWLVLAAWIVFVGVSVIGDVVNVAARLQAEARAGEVLITDDTFRLVMDHVETEELGAIYVKGRLAPVTMYKVTAVRP